MRRTRPLGAKKVALLRLACRGRERGASWRKVLLMWNNEHPDWKYTSVRDLQSEFHDAEERLTGEDHGLEWFYDLRYRARSQPEALRKLTGNELEAMKRPEASAQERRMARRFEQRLWRDAGLSEGRSSLHQTISHIAHGAQQMADEGYSIEEIVAQATPEGLYEAAPEAAVDWTRWLLELDLKLYDLGEVRAEYSDATRPPKTKFEPVDEYDESTGYHIIGRLKSEENSVEGDSGLGGG